MHNAPRTVCVVTRLWCRTRQPMAIGLASTSSDHRITIVP